MRYFFELVVSCRSITAHRLLKMTSRVAQVLCAVAIVTFVVFGLANEAAAQVPTLEGETFQSQVLKNSKVTCSADIPLLNDQ